MDKIHLDLIGALMHMVNQFFHENSDGTVCHACMFAEQWAIETLCELGFAEELEPGMNGYKLNWDKYEALKEELMHGK